VVQYGRVCVIRFFQVVQYGRSQEDGVFGDAIMTILPPVSQYSNNYHFGPMDLAASAIDNYMSAIVPAQFKDDITWVTTYSDGSTNSRLLSSLTTSQWTVIPGTKPMWMGMVVSVGTDAQMHLVFHPSASVTFALMLFGYARGESYSFPAGRLINMAPQVS